MAAWRRFVSCLPSVQKIGDKLERAAIANDLAGYLAVDAGLVLDQFKKAATDRRAAAGAGGAQGSCRSRRSKRSC